MFSISLHKKAFVLYAFFLLFVFSAAHSQTNISGIVNSYTPVTSISICSIDVLDASAFSVGNRVMIIQIKGATIDTTSNTSNFGDVLNLNTCGNYEFGHVSSIVGNTIFLTAPLLRNYTVTGRVQLIKVPQYTNAVITAPVTCPVWNGSVGGVVVIECSGTLTFNDNIDGQGKGFNFGNVSPTGYNCPGSFNYFYPSTSYYGGEKGEGISFVSDSKINGMGKLANGGGGGNNVNAGGAGGGNFGQGGNGGYSWEGCPIMDIGGRGGQSLSYTNLLNKVFLGGGGGGGQQNNLQATAGTNGGGIVILRAANILGNGHSINVGAFNTLTGGCDGAGGGGAGGSVLLDVTTFTGTLNINANGGNGSTTSCYAQGASGGGGGGCVWSKTILPNNVLTNVTGGIRGIEGSGSQDGLPGDTLSGLTIIGTPFIFTQIPIATSTKDTICFGASATIGVTPNGIGYTYKWAPGISLSDSTIYNPLATPAISTIYNVIVTYPNGCRISAADTVTVNPAPVAAFKSTKVCHGNATQFTDSSYTASGTIISWTWNFGDGSPVSITQSPSHTYVNSGIYNVSLIVKNSFGCSNNITKTAQVYYNPIVGFTHSDVCYGDTLHFSNTSTIDPSTSIASYLWVFGDGGTTSTLKNPVHYYSNPGAYTVTLVATSANGCADVANNTVNAFAAPTSAFTFNNICLHDSATFANTSINPAMGTIANWSWNFGDGYPPNTTLWNPSHLYTSSGNYQVSLITHSSNLGCADTLQHTITVYYLPVANFGFNNVCLNEVMNFHDSSVIAVDTISNWLWNFGDTTPLTTIQNPNHTYSNSGTDSILLIVITNHGCKDTSTKSIVVHPLPVVQFVQPNVCAGNSIHFIDLSSITSTDTIHLQTWNFGDGSPLNTTANPSHLYAAGGSFHVQLVVISNFGCKDSITKTAIINPDPIVNFTAQNKTGCEPLCVNFQDSSYITTGHNAQWAWNFGDGHSGSEPNNCFANDSVFSPMYFTVILTVTSDSGCISVKSKNNFIMVYPKPSAGFGVQPSSTTIIDPIISITDLSAGTNFWTWDFGGSAPLTTGYDTTTKHNPPPHTYADTGTYTITLIASSLYGCADTAYQTIIIEPDFNFFIPSSFSPNDDGVNDSFSGKGVFVKEYEMSIFDRWGNLIFFSNDYNKPWDGKANLGTETAQQDVYIYSIKITDFNNVNHKYKGVVTLIR